jgi:hypothetical protein
MISCGASQWYQPANRSTFGAVYATLCVLAPALYETMAKESLKLVAASDMNGVLKKAQELEAKWIPRQPTCERPTLRT